MVAERRDTSAEGRARRHRFAESLQKMREFGFRPDAVEYYRGVARATARLPHEIVCDLAAGPHPSARGVLGWLRTGWSNLPVARVLFLVMVAATATWIARPPASAAVERLHGIYLQQAIEFATVDDRQVLLTRMTRFRKCGGRRGVAEDYNGHIVEVAGQDVVGLGFVAGIVDAIEGCGMAR